MKLAVDVELDGDRATITWPQRPVILDDAGLAALIEDITTVRARLGFVQQTVELWNEGEI